MENRAVVQRRTACMVTMVAARNALLRSVDQGGNSVVDRDRHMGATRSFFCVDVLITVFDCHNDPGKHI